MRTTSIIKLGNGHVWLSEGIHDDLPLLVLTLSLPEVLENYQPAMFTSFLAFKHITSTRKTCCWRKHRVFFSKESELRVFVCATNPMNNVNIPFFHTTISPFWQLPKNIKKWKKCKQGFQDGTSLMFSTSFPHLFQLSRRCFRHLLGETTSNLSRKRTSMMTGQLTAWAKVKIDSSFFFPRKKDTLW